MTPDKTVEQLKTELAMANARLQKMADSLAEENRVVRLLVAAGLVNEEKVTQARDLARNHK